MIRRPDEIAPVLKRAFDIEGPVLIGVRADYRDNHVRLCVQKQHRLTAPDASISWISTSEGYV
jgi:thiamine pyrophosphate-dependent acetolactate synthase large subunit-like protein